MQRRYIEEKRRLEEDANLRTYFRLESFDWDQNLGRHCVYGYVLPRTVPYNDRAFKVRIVLSTGYPIEPLTYIYHPAIGRDGNKLKFCCACCSLKCQPTRYLSNVIEHYVNIIEQPNGYCARCNENVEARELFERNRAAYNEKARALTNDALRS